MNARRKGIIIKMPSRPPSTPTVMMRTTSMSKPSSSRAGMVTPTPKAIDSPADPLFVIPPAAFPYANAANVVYDSGDYAGALDKALAILDIEQTQRDIAERRARGEVVGLGIASCVEVSGGGGD